MKILKSRYFKYMSLLLVSLLLFSTFSNAERDKEEGISFVGDNDRPVRIVLQESPSENESAVILFAGSKSFEIGTLKFFGHPCIVKASNWDSQLVIIPYYLGGGTGYGVYNWCLVTTENSKPICKFMGLAHYHSVSRNSYTFDLVPSLINRDENKNACFAFTLITKMDGICNVIEGNVSLVIKRKKNECEFSLAPTTEQDAKSCVKLLRSNIKDVAEWAESRLATIVPNEIREYKNSKDSPSLIGILESAIEDHYEY